MSNRITLIVVGVCLCATYMLVSALAEIGAVPVPVQSAADYTAKASMPSLLSANDMTIKNTSSKYKYKSEQADEANQAWKVAAECPTSYSTFDGISNVRMQGRKAGRANSLDHQFALKPSGISGKSRTNYQGKFFPWDAQVAGKSSGGGGMEKYACGVFKAKIVTDKKTGQHYLRFLYAVTKASQLGELAETNKYSGMKNDLDVIKKTNGAINIEYAMSLGGEMHDTASTASFKASKNAAAGKVVKPPKS
ncbi:MAG: hypothetical protein NTV22_06755 [bacterium]|nr:hypothetical protein [bacterium]